MESSHDRSSESCPRFRIRVCLKRYFEDERALAYVSVRGEARVRWLQRRLRALFALPPPFALLCAGHLLPPDEPLALLHPDDLVDVLPTRLDHDENWNGVEKCPDVDCGRPGISSAWDSFPESDRDPGDRCDPVDRCDLVECEPDVTPADFDMTPSSPGAAREYDECHVLNERKRRALALLDEHCDTRQSGEHMEPRSRRRRVRRRRRQQPAAPPSEATSPAVVPAPSQTTSPAVVPAPSQTTSPAGVSSPSRDSSPPCGTSTGRSVVPSAGSEDAVLRNLVQIPRTPRLIRPLVDAAAF